MSGPRILILGAGGQVGQELRQAAWPAGTVLSALDRQGCDVADAAAVETVVAGFKPDLLVNASAYTAVDKAESDADTAFAVNRDAPAAMAASCARHGAGLVHISTDYVFDGSAEGAYREEAPVCPLGVYGASKLAGEQAIQQRTDRALILRTAWVFGAQGGNFLKTMLRLGADRPELRVVADQRGCPTPADAIAAAIATAAPRLLADDRAWGIYHYAGAPATHWHGFAEAIFDAAQAYGRPRPVVHPITTADYPTPARRPANSVLDSSRFASAFGVPAADWRAGIDRVLQQLLGAGTPA